MFTLTLAVSEILRFEMFDLEIFGEDSGMQHSQWLHAIANMTSVNVIPECFIAFCHCFSNISILNCMTLNIMVKFTMYNICRDAIPWQMHDFLCDGNSNGCYISPNYLRHIRKFTKLPKV